MDRFPLIDKKKTGQRIRHQMFQKGYCVRDIQDELHLGSVQCVYQWMNGRSLPTLDNLYALSVLFDVRVEELIVTEQQKQEI